MKDSENQSIESRLWLLGVKLKGIAMAIEGVGLIESMKLDSQEAFLGLGELLSGIATELEDIRHHESEACEKNKKKRKQ